jgi:outer membrane protein W
MRRAAMFVAVLMCAVAASAADPSSGATQLSVFTSNLAFGQSSTTGSQSRGGIGLALSRAWTPRWSTEISVAAERHRDAYGLFSSVFPVDLTAQYRFTNGSRWTPYLNAGFRYVSSPAHSNVNPTFGGADRNSPEVGAGTTLRLTPRLGLRFDMTRLLRNDSVLYDPLTRGSVGLSWKF